MESEVKKNTEVVAVTKEVGQVPAPVKVVDIATRAAAHERVTAADKALKVIHSRLDESKKRARAVWQDWNDLINELAAPWEQDKDFHVNQVKLFDRAERIKAEQLQRELEQKAIREAEEKKLAEAELAEKQGHHEEAAAIVEEPVEINVPVVKADLPKLDARKYQTRWKARVTDKEELIIFVAEMIKKSRDKSFGPALCQAYAEYVNALDANESWLNTKARANEASLAIPGVMSYEQ